MKHLKILVSGRVQGVFFRATAKKKADELGIKGFVRNQPDGTVYIEAEGDNGALKLFLDFCNEGPREAEVKSVAAEQAEMRHFSDFRIEY